MAGKLIVDTIDTDNSFITLNVQQATVATINSGGIYSQSGTKIIGSDGSISTANTLYLGANATSPLGGTTNPVLGMILAANNYIQSYIYNPSNTALSSADIACYPNNGSDANGWIDMGITSNAYSYSAYPITGRNEGYILMSAPGGSGTSGNLVFATDSTGTYNSIQFYNGGFSKAKSNTSATINQYGLGLGSAVPTSGVGIAFPATQSASSDANTLDDYEEGTWTPSAASTSGSITTYTSVGTYTKIGRLVYVSGAISTTNKGTASGAMTVGNFPFTSSNWSSPAGNRNSIGLVREDASVGEIYQMYINSGLNSGAVYLLAGGTLTWNNAYVYVFTLVYTASA